MVEKARRPDREDLVCRLPEKLRSIDIHAFQLILHMPRVHHTSVAEVVGWKSKPPPPTNLL